jgi:hypothetical protein
MHYRSRRNSASLKLMATVLCGSLLLGLSANSAAQTPEWKTAPARFADSAYWRYTDAEGSVDVRLIKAVDPGGEVLQAVRMAHGTPVFVKVVQYDGLDTTGVTLRVHECPGTVGLADAYKKYSAQGLYQRPDGGIDSLFAAYAAANAQSCMNFDESRTYRVPPPPITTNVTIFDVSIRVDISVSDGTRLLFQHR